jgi:hypothetical protein
MYFGKNQYPRISFELPYTMRQKVSKKVRTEGTTIKLVGIKLFEKWVADEVKLSGLYRRELPTKDQQKKEKESA